MEMLSTISYPSIGVYGLMATRAKLQIRHAWFLFSAGPIVRNACG